MTVMVNWKFYFLIGIFAVLSLPVAAKFGVREIWCFSVFFYGLAGVFFGIKLNKPAVRSPWVYLILALTLQFIGSIIEANTDASGRFGAGLSPADCFLLFSHLLMLVSLWQFASIMHLAFPKHGFFQGWIMATSLILVGWQFLFLPTIIQFGFSVHLPQAFRMIYPTMSYMEVGMLLWIWISSEANQSKAFILLAMATIFLHLVNRCFMAPVIA